jgi:tetratricopeptide (TPR) repeat protein
MQANPADPAPRQALLRFLIEQKRLDEAFNLTEISLQYTPKDANLLIDRGFLALQRGHADEARADWDMAITADPSQVNAHLYLANELDREDKAQAAAAHYNAYLEKVVKQPAENRPAADKIVAIVLRMADCQARSSQTELAVKSYHLAEKLAAQTRQTKLESVADVNEAALQTKIGKLGEALQLYQHAIQLDTSINDNSATAQDWFAYGRFLDDAGFPARLAYACVVRSESVAQLLPKETIPVELDTTRKQIEKRLGASAAGIRRDPEPALQEALALRR